MIKNFKALSDTKGRAMVMLEYPTLLSDNDITSLNLNEQLSHEIINYHDNRFSLSLFQNEGILEFIVYKI